MIRTAYTTYHTACAPDDGGSSGAAMGPMDVASAAAALGAQERPRDPAGRFQPAQAKDQVQEEQQDPPKVVDLKTRTAPVVEDVVDDSPANEDEEDVVEIAAEEDGAEPRRLKVSDLVAGYDEAAKLREELDRVSAGPQIPDDVQVMLDEMAPLRQRYLQGMDILARLITPRQPNAAAFAGDSDGYLEAMSRYEHDKAHAEQVLAEIKSQSTRQTQEDALRSQAAQARAAAEVRRGWPEFAQNIEVQKDTLEGLVKHYGFTREAVAAISDPRLLYLARDALQFQRSKQRQVAAVKVVRAKPKIVRGSARPAAISGAVKRDAAMQKLQTSGSMDAAVEALSNIIQR